MGDATSNRVAAEKPRFLLARHPDCGKVVASIVIEPTWPENEVDLAKFRLNMAKRSRPVEAAAHCPMIDGWCNCFGGTA